MDFQMRCLIFAAASCCLLAMPLVNGAEIPPDLLQDDHFREELGVNEFTAPSIEKILRDIELLRPIPYQTIRREPDASPPSDRVEVALGIGALIAQGFALVDAQSKDDVEALARALIKHARALSIIDAVMPRAQSLAEKGLRGDWQELKEELAKAQSDAEAAMLKLRDEEIAHLVSLGGWIRALEICSAAVLEKYTAEKASVLVRLDLLDYFIERMETLHPAIRRREVIQTMLSELKTIRQTLNRPEGTTIYESDVRDIYARSKRIIDMMLSDESRRAKEKRTEEQEATSLEPDLP